MRDELLAERRQAHRRNGIKVKRQVKFSPTAIWTTDAEDDPTPTPPPAAPATTAPPAATSKPPDPPETSRATPSTPTPASPTRATPATTSPSPPATPATTQPSPSPALPSTNSSASVSSASLTPAKPATPVTTAAPTKPAVTRSATTSAITTISRNVSATDGAASIGASPTSSAVPEESGGVNGGVVFGGVVAGIAGIAFIVWAITFFMRRARRKEEEDAAAFNADTFRRQSTVLPDEKGNPPSRSMTMGGYDNSPPPQPMYQQRSDYAPVAYPGSPISAQTYNDGGAYGYQRPSFQPGEVVNMGQAPGTSTTPFTVITAPANPFFSPIGESPMNSPTVAPYNSAYNDQGQFMQRQNSVGASAYLTRQPSMGQQNGELGSEAHYVDLSRSSVTPFQAQQYEEISRRLNTTPPMPLSAFPTILEQGRNGSPDPQTNTRPLDLGHNITTDSPHLNTYQGSAITESPFADAHAQAKSPEPVDNGPSVRDAIPPRLPSPAFSTNSRVPSAPPILPDIHIEQRSFSPISQDFPLVPSSVRPSPSPLSTSFNLPTPPVEAHFSGGNSNISVEQSKGSVGTPKEATTAPATKDNNPVKRPETVYDDEDAYAGI